MNVAYVHPIVGALVLALLVYTGSLGLRGRGARRGKAALLARHGRIGPVVLALVLANWAGGALSTLWLRGDLTFAASLHFRIGTLMALFLTGNALTARSMEKGNALARDLHPWLGAGALLLAAAHAATGLRVMP